MKRYVDSRTPFFFLKKRDPGIGKMANTFASLVVFFVVCCCFLFFPFSCGALTKATCAKLWLPFADDFTTGHRHICSCFPGDSTANEGREVLRRLPLFAQATCPLQLGQTPVWESPVVGTKRHTGNQASW